MIFFLFSWSRVVYTLQTFCNIVFSIFDFTVTLIKIKGNTCTVIMDL
uniref:Uncharacterized protein n=1 Tax=Anguilla anguilla TaxID=7936 RepID=A0A0E9QTK4_ANGAN